LRQTLKSLQHLGRLTLDDVDANIGVKQIAH
jgi:hypothetical protein